MKRYGALFLAAASLFFAADCSFNYEDGMQTDLDLPDISMTRLDYVRMKSGQRQIRLTAESGDRYDDKQFMNLHEYTFAQYMSSTGDVDAAGWGGFAHVELGALDVKMTDGISIVADSDDIELEANTLDYRDNAKTLKSDKDETVIIRRQNGTDFSGKGFSADVRARTFEFTSGVEGVYVYDENDEEEEEVSAEAAGDGEEESAGGAGDGEEVNEEEAAGAGDEEAAE